jgi:hypothetical protein
MKLSRCLFLISLFVIQSVALKAQDTTVVQTLTWDSVGRAGFYHFPDEGSFERVVMLYNMRCHHALVSNGNKPEQGCGQWDYNCETFIWDSTRTDSLRNKWPSAIVTNWPQYSNYPYTTRPTYSVVRHNEKLASYSPAPSLTAISTARDSGSTTEPFGGTVSRSLYLYKASELITDGLKTAPIIGAITLNNGAGMGGSVRDLRIRMHLVKNGVFGEALSRDTAFAEVYRATTSIASGNNTLYFYKSFTWDSVSDIAVEISHTQKITDFPGLLLSSGSSTGSSLTSSTQTAALSFSSSEFLQLAPRQFRSITGEITIAFWAYGDTTKIPGSNTIFMEGIDAAQHRQVNIHLPWSDNNIYWDCGGDASGNYDRISKAAKKYDMSRRWNHWAFTKNVATGKMAIYLNGSLFASDTGKRRPIDIQQMSLGMAMTSNLGYFGDVRQFALFKVALDSNAIRAVMLQDSMIAKTSGVICYYPFDEATGQQANDRVAGIATTVTGGAVWHSVRGAELPNNFVVGNRANLTFQGSATKLVPTVTDRYTYDSIANHANSVIRYRIGPNYGFHTNDSVVVIDTQFGRYLAAKTYTYNEQGKKIDSVSVPAEDTVRPTALRYFTRAPQKFELMSFVTPYGINLDLGKGGKTYEFDVTDYVPVLKGWKRLTMERGSGQEEFDLKFLFIKGTPARNVIDMQQIWPMTEEAYQTIMADDRYEPRSVNLNANAKGFKLRSYITGHGGTAGGNGEFTPQTHYLSVDAKKFQREVWKVCSIDPLYPQGGTWPINRAGWCPGMATDLAEYEITNIVTPGHAVTIDYGVNGGVGDSRYDPSTQLVTYGAPNFTTDAALTDIWRPSNRIEFGRFNPACDNPVVVLKNNGSQRLDSVTLEYFVDNGPHKTYVWHGGLAFTDTQSVILPVDSLGFWASRDTSTFHVNVVHVNAFENGVDEYPQNDRASSTFIRPPSYTGIVVAKTVMNKDPGSYTLHIYNSARDEIFLRDDFEVKKTYFDSLTLPVGCYTIRMDDENEEGLSFWADTALGSGSLRLQDAKGKVLKTFQADFGKFTQMDFAITQSSAAVNAGDVPYQRVSMSPNPAHSRVHVELDGYPAQLITIELLDVKGSIVHREQRFTNDIAGLRADLDISQLARGSYFVRIATKDGSTTQPLSVE